jgi:hypothetical protein
MSNERSQPTPKEKAPPPKPEKAGRSGEGARSVIPHLRADQKAKAVAQIAKRRELEL